MSRPLYKNKYVIIFVVLAVWFTFFDQNNLVYLYKLNQQIDELEHEKAFYQGEITKLKEQNEALSTDEKTLEKFARETYLMKRKDEVLFLVDED